MRVLIVDNYDSFTYNVAHLFGELNVEVRVIRNDDDGLSTDDVDACDLLVIGPGPGRPADSGKSMQLIAYAVEKAHPMFGICLGQQAIGEFFGGSLGVLYFEGRCFLGGHFAIHITGHFLFVGE